MTRPAAAATVTGAFAAFIRRVMGLPAGDWLIRYRNHPHRRSPVWMITPAPLAEQAAASDLADLAADADSDQKWEGV